MRFEEILFGSVTVKIEGFDIDKIADEAVKTCKVISVHKENDALYIKLYAHEYKKLISFAENQGQVCTVMSKKGMAFWLSKYLKRYGLISGAVIAAIFVVYLSNIVMKIEINGTENSKLISDIISILKNEGLSPGTFIPSQNFMELESRLYEVSDSISWVSIGHEGSLVIVNISESTPKAYSISKRIPSNIIASRDGVIVNAEVFAGQLSVLIGSGVSKGEILVSGIVERANGRAYYYHSVANITAQYEQEYEIHQDLVGKAESEGESVYTRSLKFFDLELELPSLKGIPENSSKETDITMLSVFGIELPFGVVTNKYTEIVSDVYSYTYEQALNEAYRRLEIIEKGLLSEQEIIEREVAELLDETGVTLKVNYTLVGDIGKQSYIFAN